MAIVLLPVLLGFIYSLLYSFGLVGLLNRGFTLEHWSRLLSTGDSWSALLYTLYLTLSTCVLSLLLSWFYVWRVFRKPNVRSVFWLYIPLLFPPLIASMAWYFILNPSGMISRWLHWMGVIQVSSDFPWLVNDDWSVGIIITQVFLVFPIFTILFLNISKKENLSDLYKSARNLGSQDLFFLKKVFVPILWLRARSVILLYILFLMGTYEVTLLLGKNHPRTITVFIMEKMGKYNLADIPQAHAMSVLYSSIMFVSLILFLKLSKSSRI